MAPEKQKLKVNHNKKKGGLAITFQVQKTVLGFLEDEGFENLTIGKPGEPRTVPLQIGICDKSFCVDVGVLYKAKLDKNGSAKGKLKAQK